MTRRMVHARMADLGIDRVLHARGDLRNAPVALAAPLHGQPVVVQCSPQAAVAGVRIGQRVAEARVFCPGLHAESMDPTADRRWLLEIAGECRGYTPWIGIDHAGLFLDITGCAHLFGGEDALLDALAETLADCGARARLALADTPGAAWAWSAAGNVSGPARILAPGAQMRALASLPVAALRLSAADAAFLDRLGIATIGALMALPRRALRSRFGEGVGLRLDQAMGRVAEPVAYLPQPLPMAVSSILADPVATREGLDALVEDLFLRLAADLARHGAGVRRLVLSLRRIDGLRLREDLETAFSSRDAWHLLGLFAPRLERVDPHPGIESAHLEAVEYEPLRTVPPLLDLGIEAPLEVREGALGALIDRLASRLGADRVLRPALREAHLPEMQTRWRPASEAAAAIPDGWPDGLERPVLLLRRPERVQAVCGGDGGRPPESFVWRGRRRHLARVGGAERIAGPWWRPGEEVRDYARVEEDGGRRLWMMRDRDGGWAVHGLFG